MAPNGSLYVNKMIFDHLGSISGQKTESNQKF